jgi:hypothetical protein
MEHLRTECDWEESKRQYWAEIGDFDVYCLKVKKRWDRERRSELSIGGLIAEGICQLIFRARYRSGLISKISSSLPPMRIMRRTRPVESDAADREKMAFFRALVEKYIGGADHEPSGRTASQS